MPLWYNITASYKIRRDTACAFASGVSICLLLLEKGAQSYANISVDAD